MQWFVKALSSYATFSGRARRSEYWYFTLFALLASLALGVVDGLAGTDENFKKRCVLNFFTIKTQRFELNNYLFLYFAHVPIFRRQESRLGIPSPCPDREPKTELGAGN